ncbi:MAG: serine/threonine-protein kinase [Byssovorax sp.]
MAGIVLPLTSSSRRGSGVEARAMSVAAMASVGALHAGSILGRYELLLPIAQGGMATVWAARMKGTRGFSKIVAIKTMLPALSNDPRFEQMFLGEAEIASRIKHPNVCEILDLGEENGTLYLAMEWIDGESLMTLQHDAERQERPLPYAVITRLGIDAAKGLHAAHELRDEAGAPIGVVHRDVSPHNILVTYDGRLKIVDFGVAKAVARSDHQATQAGTIKGKVQFMAPEQAFGDDVDRRVDVFALGIVLYQMITGDHPFRADNELATMARIVSPEPVPSPRAIAEDCPEELAAVVLRALAKKRDDRYPTMADLARDLEQCAGKLSMPDPAHDPESFIRDVLKERAEERAAVIKQALRAADDRSSGVTLSGVTPIPRERRSDLGLPVGDDDPTGRASSVASTATPGRAGKSIALAAGVFAAGAVIGAAALIGVTRSAAPPGALPMTSSALMPAPPPSAAVESVTAATTASAAVTASASASVAPMASAPSAIPAASLKGPMPGATGKAPTKKFRNPGF